MVTQQIVEKQSLTNSRGRLADIFSDLELSIKM